MILNSKNFSIAKTDTSIHCENKTGFNYNTLQVDRHGTFITNGCWAIAVEPVNFEDLPGAPVLITKDSALQHAEKIGKNVSSWTDEPFKLVTADKFNIDKIMPNGTHLAEALVSLRYLKQIVDQMVEFSEEYGDNGPDYAHFYFNGIHAPVHIQHKHLVTGQTITGWIMPCDPSVKDGAKPTENKPYPPVRATGMRDEREIDGVPVWQLIEMGIYTQDDADAYFLMMGGDVA